MFLNTKWKRGASNRSSSSTELGSYLGKYLSNLAIFHDLSNHNEHTMKQRAHKRTIEKVHCVLGKIMISKANTFLPVHILPKMVGTSQIRLTQHNTQSVRTSSHKDLGPGSTLGLIYNENRNFVHVNDLSSFLIKNNNKRLHMWDNKDCSTLHFEL